MALPILDGNQSATTLSTILSSGQHITAHTVVSLGTQAVTDISTAVGLLQSAVATQGSVANTAFVKIGGHTGTATTGNIVHVSSVGAMKVDASASTQPISGTVTIGSALPTGTNRIGVVTIGGGTVTIGAGTAQIGSVTASGTVTAVLAGWELLGQRDFYADGSSWIFSSSIIGSYSSIAITFGNGDSSSLRASYTSLETQDNDVYWTSQDGGRTRDINSGAGFLMATALPATLIIGVYSTPFSTMTASLYGKKDSTLALTNTQLRSSAVTVSGNVTIGTALPAGTNRIGVVTIGGGTVTIGAGTAQLGSVTASISNSVTVSALPSGALTTRFGSVTTANTSQITTAVTNTSRKYLLAQNISTATVTIGIGFSPTTTQGIQLTAGAGLTFDSFVPTGAVYWLGATTGAAYTILEG
jgi:hypothetical protein